MTDLNHTIWLGDFPIAELKPNLVSVQIAKNVHITFPLLAPHTLARGDKLPLYIQVPHAKLGPPNANS